MYERKLLVKFWTNLLALKYSTDTISLRLAAVVFACQAGHMIAWSLFHVCFMATSNYKIGHASAYTYHFKSNAINGIFVSTLYAG